MNVCAQKKALMTQMNDNARTKQVLTTQHGDVVYYVIGAPTADRHVLYIHGLCSSSKSCSPPSSEELQSSVRWIVPDLLGHGESAMPATSDAYRMSSHTKILREVLAKENVKRLVCIAHSMGGPIGVELCERPEELVGITIEGMIYGEGEGKL